MLTAVTQRLRRVTTGRPWVPEIDGLRFLAILGVVLFHIFGEIVARSGMHIVVAPRYELLNFAIGNGDRGVRLFFVISGLVLALPFARHFLAGSKPVTLRSYYMRRLTRLEPPYILSVLVFVLLIVLWTHEFSHNILEHLVATLFYAHNLTFGEMSPINMVSWSLEVEVQFYLLAPFFMQLFRIQNKTVRRTVLAGLVVALLPLQMYATVNPRMQASIARYACYFLSGLLLADLFVTEMPAWKERSAWDVVALACAALAIGMPHETESAHALMPFVFAFLCLAAMRGPIFRRMMATPSIAVIGGMCYSIYLMHMIAIPIVFKVSRRLILQDRMDFLAIYTLQCLLFVPAVLLFGTGFYLLIERPCMDPHWPAKLKQWFLVKTRQAKVLVLDALAVHDLDRREPQDAQVEPERLALDILSIELHLFRNAEFIPAVYLCPASEAWFDLRNAVLRSQRNQVMLIEQRGTWSDKAQITS